VAIADRTTAGQRIAAVRRLDGSAAVATSTAPSPQHSIVVTDRNESRGF
jgi:hypothetical protein